ncbi:MAG: hypothetical protein H7837_06490 [Magnetococcus sp. MYC-9]
MAEQVLTRVDNAVVGMIDIVSSTSQIMGNPRDDQAVRAVKMLRIIQVLQREIQAFAIPVSFTGDGLLFYVAAQSDRRIIDRMAILAGLVRAELNDQPLLPMRIGFSRGTIFSGQVGPGPNIIGVPVVEVSRLMAEKEMFDSGTTNSRVATILATEDTLETGVTLNLWGSLVMKDWQKIEPPWEPRGLPGYLVSIYRYI